MKKKKLKKILNKALKENRKLLDQQRTRAIDVHVLKSENTELAKSIDRYRKGIENVEDMYLDIIDKLKKEQQDYIQEVTTLVRENKELEDLVTLYSNELYKQIQNGEF